MTSASHDASVLPFAQSVAPPDAIRLLLRQLVQDVIETAFHEFVGAARYARSDTRRDLSVPRLRRACRARPARGRGAPHRRPLGDRRRCRRLSRTSRRLARDRCLRDAGGGWPSSIARRAARAGEHARDRARSYGGPPSHTRDPRPSERGESRAPHDCARAGAQRPLAGTPVCRAGDRSRGGRHPRSVDPTAQKKLHTILHLTAGERTSFFTEPLSFQPRPDHPDDAERNVSQ